MVVNNFRYLVDRFLRKKSDKSLAGPLDRDGARIALRCFLGTGKTNDLWKRFVEYESPAPEIEDARRQIIDLSKKFPSTDGKKFCNSEGFLKIQEIVEKVEEIFQAEFREPSNYEMAILELLLKPEFPGAERLRAQLDGLMVRPLDDDGCLELQVKDYIRQYPVKYMHSPVEATYAPNGVWGGLQPKVHVVLYTDDRNYIMELEFWNEVPCDFRLPQIDELKVEVNDSVGEPKNI